jgi:hypothetical protein
VYPGTLSILADELDATGYDAHELRGLQDELDALERPPGLLTRMSQAAHHAAARHWRHFVDELGESKEAMGLIVARIQGGRLSPEDADKIRAQLVDLVKIFPAGLIAAANSAFPLPGTGLFTPWILCRLGLMPSRWREAHLLETLRRQRKRLLAQGRVAQAHVLEELEHEIEREAEMREHVARDTRLLSHWDANGNGTWDPSERLAYRRALERVRVLARRHATKKRWFLEMEGEIYGALRLSELFDDGEVRSHLDDDDMLVCYDGKTGWVAMPHLLGREPWTNAAE